MSLSTVLSRVETVAQKPFPLSLASLVIRFALAVPFFKSGLTKWDGFLKISDTPELLFTEEFKLHIFGAIYDYPFPKLMAWGSSLGEIILPVFLVIGLGTRLAALGLLFMTALIQITIPDGWANFHLPWAAMAIAIIVLGPGKLSLDWLLRKAQ
jgi:putative oxidoreductase